MIIKKWGYYLVAIFTLLVVAFLTMSYIGRGLFDVNYYNSFSIQANAWMHGHLDIPSNYSHLEIAIYEGKYFISFPPFPSVVLLPLVMIFGMETPDHLLGIIFGIISLVVAIRICQHYLENIGQSLMLALLLVLGSNYLHVFIWGSVWYIAQNMAFAFTLLSIYFAITNKQYFTYLSLFFLCCAAGCRPFQLVYTPLIVLLLYKRSADLMSIKQFSLQLIKWALPAIVLGLCYMTLNYARFNSVFEFGHNYLPEFSEAEHGQFSLIYIIDNLKTIFFKMPEYVEGVLEFPKFDGVAMWIVSPMLLLYLGLLIDYLIMKILVKKDFEWTFIVSLSLALVLGHICLLALHKTLGGYHFGNRYTVDVLPVVFLCIVLLIKDSKFRDELCFLASGLMIVGCIINVVGTIML